MDTRPDDMDRVIEDLKFIKTAIAKSSSIMRWLPLSRVMRRVYLMAGLIMTVFCGVLYLVTVKYGSLIEAPLWIRVSSFGSAIVAFVSVAAYKALSILAGARKIRSDYTLSRLMRDVYTGQTMVVMVPFIIVAVGIVAFLVGRGLSQYIVPSIAILLGLLLNALVTVFSLKELLVGGDWFIVTGLLGLFLGERLDPLLGLILTFGLGFIATYVAGTLMATGEGEGGEHGLE